MYDLIILGGGPAGMTAAVYAARKKLSTLIISENFGGLAVRSPLVENYLGYQYITGAELVKKFEEHLNTFDIDKKLSLAMSIVKTEAGFKVHTKDTKEFEGKTVIVSTGRSIKYLDVPGEKEYYGKGVSYCSVCDGPLFANMDVAVIGDGNAALEAVIQMSAIAKTVILIAGEELKANDIVTQRATALQNVKISTFAEVAAIKGNGFVSGIDVRDLKSSQIKSFPVQGILIEIGSIPVSTFITDLAELNDKGEIIIDCMGRTKTPGLFAAGDVTHVPQKQIIIAAGEGAKAALSAYSYIIEH